MQVGSHLIIDFFDAECPSDEQMVKLIIATAIKEIGATLIKIDSHKFQPHGITCVALLAESHMSVHTWPERKYVALDIFTCGIQDPKAALPSLRKAFKPKREEVRELHRGVDE